MSLSKFLATHPWTDAQAGPMIVVDPDKVLGPSTAASLGDFGRMKKTVGSLTAIAPIQMVLIDNSFSSPPNLYDGLDRASKVRYLLATLNSDQWSALLKGGIGLGDLDGEQRKVFISLMPPQVSWNLYTTDDRGDRTLKDQGSVPPDAIGQVRLYVARKLDIAVRRADQKNVMTIVHTSKDDANQTFRERNSSGDDQVGQAFGVQFKNAVPNEFKRSNLDHSRLNSEMEVPPASTIQQLLDKAGAATGLELHADLRVGDLPTKFSGTYAPVGDLLKALAFEVTGTFRKVGSAYVLTSDLAGMGTRKMQFAIWGDAVEEAERAREATWNLQIAQKGEIFKAGFDPNDPLRPGPGQFDPNEDDGMGSPKTWHPLNELSPAIQANVRNQIQNAPGMALDGSGASLSSSFYYGFVLPNGQRLAMEDSIGDGGQLRSLLHPRTFAVPFSSGQDSAKTFLAIKPIGPEVAIGFVELAAKRHIPELWIDSRDENLLKAALQSAGTHHVKIRLLVQPFADDGKLPDDPDRTLLGENAGQVGSRRADGRWSQSQSSPNWIGAWEQPSYSPSDPGLPSRWQKIAHLAHLDGFSGVVLRDTEPYGYEGVRDNTTRALTPTLKTSVDYGFSTLQRLEFLRKNDIDPIDIAPATIASRPDLRQPFFLDDNLQGQGRFFADGVPNPLMRGEEAKWDQFRNERNRKAVSELVELLEAGKTPLLIEKRDTLINQVPSRRAFVEVSPGQELPPSAFERFGAPIDWSGVILLTIPSPPGKPFDLAPGAIQVIDVGDSSPPEVDRFLEKLLSK